MADIVGRSSLAPARLVTPQERDQARGGYKQIHRRGSDTHFVTPPPHISFFFTTFVSYSACLFRTDQTRPDHADATEVSQDGPHPVHTRRSFDAPPFASFARLRTTQAHISVVFGRRVFCPRVETPHSMPRAAPVEHLRHEGVRVSPPSLSPYLQCSAVFVRNEQPPLPREDVWRRRRS